VPRVVVRAPLGLTRPHRQEGLRSVERLKLGSFHRRRQRRRAQAGRLRPTMSRACSTNRGSDESLNVSERCGCKAKSRKRARFDESWTARGPPLSPLS
jgi:hypothetical protein